MDKNTLNKILFYLYIINKMKKALLIGINYIGTKYELGGCINDINDIKELLTKKYNYLPQNINVLTDDTQIKPTKKDIQDAIIQFVKGVSTGDTLFFYYSGHGSQILVDKLSNNYDDVLVPIDYRQSGFITDEWLYDNLANSLPKGVTLWSFADCCHSGTILNLEYNLIHTRTENIDKTEYKETDWLDQYTLFLIKNSKKKIDTQADVYMISGCMDNQTSADTGTQGAFTSCFLETIKNKNQNLNPKIIEVLKEIDCRLNIGGFEQVCQLSIGILDDINKELLF